MVTQRGYDLKRKHQEESTATGEEEEQQRKTAPAATPNRGRINFILDKAAIKKIPMKKKKWKIPRSFDDAEIILSHKKAIDDFRSDIVHEALRAILDSPLNKYGLVGAIYVKIENGVLFEVKPEVRIPRTLERLCGLMGDLLEKSCIRSQETHKTLLRVIEEPVTKYIPANHRVIGLSQSSNKLVNIEDYVSAASDDMDFTFVLQIIHFVPKVKLG